MVIQQYTWWVGWFNDGWRDGLRGNKVRETFAYLIDYNLTHLPPLSELTLLARSGALGGLSFLSSGRLVCVEFPALLWVSMLLLAVGTFLAGLRVG